MSLKFRLIFALVVALTIPTLSYLLYPELGIWEPLSFTLGALVLYGGYELINGLRKK